MDKLNIYQRINAVIKDLLDEGKGYLKKEGAGKFGGSGVKYDNVISVLAPKLVKHGVDVTISLIADSERSMKSSSGKDLYIYKGFYNIRYTNIDDPKDFVEHQMAGEGGDSGDKATGKASTYAQKNAYKLKFLLETGDNDESVYSPIVHDVITQEQQEGIASYIVGDDGYLNEFGKTLAKAYKFNLIMDIPSSQFDPIMAAIDKRNKECK